MRTSLLVAAMGISVACVAAIALWDDARESTEALHDFGQEQRTLAGVTALGLAAQLEGTHREAVALMRAHPTETWTSQGDLMVRMGPPEDGASTTVTLAVPLEAGRSLAMRVPLARLVPARALLERAPAVVLVRPPGGASFRRIDGRVGRIERLDATRDTTLSLTHEESASLGLPARMSIAGIGRLDTDAMGRWSVAVVTTARRERDRERRARWRLALGVVLATGLVLGFGGVAWRTQQHERALMVRDLERQRDAELSRQERASTMLTLAAGVAHEVSTPLSVISGRAEQLVARLVNDERSRRAAIAILDQSARIHEVVRGFLRVARGDVTVLERLHPAALVEAAARLVEHRFSKAEVALETDVDPMLPFIRGDVALLDQVLVNLLLNACDACERHGVVTLRATHDVSHVVLAVEDDGAGISEANAARVFEPFFSTKPSDRGTGLGLAIASEIVKIHHGTLTLEARKPRGTVATVRLPTDEER